MNKYHIYIEIPSEKGSIKNRFTVVGDSESEAENNLVESIIFHKTELIEGKEPTKQKKYTDNNDSLDFLKSMFNFK